MSMKMMYIIIQYLMVNIVFKSSIKNVFYHDNFNFTALAATADIKIL